MSIQATPTQSTLLPSFQRAKEALYARDPRPLYLRVNFALVSIGLLALTFTPAPYNPVSLIAAAVAPLPGALVLCTLLALFALTGAVLSYTPHYVADSDITQLTSEEWFSFLKQILNSNERSDWTQAIHRGAPRFVMRYQYPLHAILEALCLTFDGVNALDTNITINELLVRPEVRATLTLRDADGMLPWMVAAQNGQIAIMEAIIDAMIEDGTFIPDAVSHLGYTALHHAAAFGTYSITDAAVEALGRSEHLKPVWKIKNPDGKLPYQVAVRQLKANFVTAALNNNAL